MLSLYVKKSFVRLPVFFKGSRQSGEITRFNAREKFKNCLPDYVSIP